MVAGVIETPAPAQGIKIDAAYAEHLFVDSGEFGMFVCQAVLFKFSSPASITMTRLICCCGYVANYSKPHLRRIAMHVCELPGQAMHEWR